MSEINYRNWRSIWALVVLALLVSGRGVAAQVLDKSDLDGNGVVDVQDIEIFAGRYLGQDASTVDWCVFYESSITNPKYFRQIVSDKLSSYQLLLNLIAETYECGVVAPTGDKSDLNSDGVVNLDDLAVFSNNYLERHWESVDWCALP